MQRKELRGLLEKARGEQEFIIAVNLDIRGFSAFCKEVDSADVAIFIRNVYKKLIDEYFTDAPFIKPTGDGLLIVIPIIPYTQENVKRTAANTIRTCLKALEAFGSFFDHDLIIYFRNRVPRKVGIGLSMGSACRILSDNRILDYSGRVLNLASRLMDIARPSGVVFDVSLSEAVPDELKEFFSKGSVHLHGIAEIEPIEVYYSAKYTRIPPEYKRPLWVQEWATQQTTSLTLEQIISVRDKGMRFYIPLDNQPADTDQISIKVLYSKSVTKRIGSSALILNKEQDFQYSVEAGEPSVAVDCGQLSKKLAAFGLRNNDSIRMKIKYPK